MPHAAYPRAPPFRADDIVLVVKPRMSSTASQVVLLLPGAEALTIKATARRQPIGVHARRPWKSHKERLTVVNAAAKAHRAAAISAKACSYLSDWAISCRRRVERPPKYSFLDNVSGAGAQRCLLDAHPMPRGAGRPAKPRDVVVARGSVARVQGEGADDARVEEAMPLEVQDQEDIDPMSD